MKLRIASILIAFVVLVAVSCQTTPVRIEPSEKNTHLLIGTIVLTALGYGGYSQSSIEGIHHDHLEITIVNDKNETFLLHTYGPDGLIMSAAIPVGTWHLTKIVYKNNAGDGSWSSFTRDVSTGQRFTVQDGKVTNIGAIDWFSDNAVKKFRFTINIDYDKVRTAFQAYNPESKWADYEEVQVRI